MMTVAEPAVKQNKTKATAPNADKICLIEVKRYPYQPDHQVELLHLQAEADALLIKLQAQQPQTEKIQTEKDTQSALASSEGAEPEKVP